MTVEEFDLALTDLETRVDRLRALYENWFRGYEKTEPAVPRKDVERRVYALRKELPRNTALRFRYHQLYLKYTTMANYWQRTARQIEEGTYKPQLMRLKRKHERDQKDQERRDRRRLERAEDELPDAPRGYELDLDESLNVDDLLNELEMDEVARALEQPGPHSEPPPKPQPSPKPVVGTFAKVTKDAHTPSGARPVAQVGARESLPRASVPQEERAAQAAAAPTQTAQTVPGRPVPPVPKFPGLGAVQASQATLPGRPVPVAPGAATGNGAPRAPQAPAATGPAQGMPQPAARAPAGAFGGGASVVPRAPGSPARSPAVSAPATPATTEVGAQPAARTAAPVGLGAPAARPAASAPMASSAAAPRPAPAGPASTTVGRPAGPAPGPIQGGGTFVGRPPPASPLANSGAPDEQRLKRIYDEYAAARRRNNEAEVRYEAMVSSIQKMLPELSKKHQGKRIDFEIVVKDGRVGLKPKAI